MPPDTACSPSPILSAARRHILQSRLSNGVSVALWPDRNDSVVSVHVWVRAGSASESHGKTGLAHMLEHLMFRGTPSVPDGEFDARMEAIGAQINAATWVDYTCYTSTAPPEALDTIATLEADRLAGLDLTEEVFVAERSVVANERRQVVDSVPEARLHEHLARLAFGTGPYGHPTIGWSEDIAGYMRDDILGFHRQWYAPDQLLVVVVGAFEPGEAQELLERTFGRLSAREAGGRPPANRFVGEGQHTLAVSVPTPHVLMAWGAPGRQDPRWAAWALLEAVLGGGDGSRLPLRLEVEEQLALDVGTHLYPHAMEQMLEISVVLRQGIRPERAIAAVEEVLTTLAEEGPSEEEVLSAVRRMLVHDASALASTAGRATRMGESWITFGDAGTDFALVEQLREVSREDVQTLAQELLDPTRRLTLIGVPSEAT